MEELLAELNAPDASINTLKIRLLCREHPGLIAVANLRVEIWTLFLLGFQEHDQKVTLKNRELDKIDIPCEEQQVLDADVHRTRSDVQEFTSQSWRQVLRDILQNFCLSHDVQYKQGMNEVLAPFLYIRPPPEHGSYLTYALFEAFLFRYLERFFCLDEPYFLYKTFRMFHLLLLYFDPQLALHLHDQEFPPELYSTQWFLTFYSRSLPLQHVLRLWDMLISIDDPSFTFFIGLCLLRRKRDALLLADAEHIPEIVMEMHFGGEEQIDSVIVEAVSLYKNTPRQYSLKLCILRNLRLCCVSTTELTPQPTFNIDQLANLKRTRSHSPRPAGESGSVYDNNNSKSNVFFELDRICAIQSARCCFFLSPQELVTSVVPVFQPSASSATSSASSPQKMKTAHTVEGGDSGLVFTSDFSMNLQQYVIIDIRSFEDTVVSGAGTIPRAIQLEPEFLNRPEAFHIWLQHFDGTRGCNICIVDLPPARWTGVALWRRLLLGEGDGFFVGSAKGFEDVDENWRKLQALCGGRSSSTNSSHNDQKKRSTSFSRAESLDEESPFSTEERSIAHSDMARPAVLLALALQRHGFSNTSVLDGGFPALVEHLLRSRGSVEPMIVNHDPEKWVEFIKATGRDVQSTAASGSEAAARNASSSRKAGSMQEESFGREDLPRRVGDLTQQEVTDLALKMADRLNHPHMREQLLLRKAALG